MDDCACNIFVNDHLLGSGWSEREIDTCIPFLSSIVTVSFAHFMRNLPWEEKVSQEIQMGALKEN